MPEYDRDLIGWAQAQAALLRADRLGEIDAEHIADEIEDVGAAQAVELQSGIRQILSRLINLQLSPSHDRRHVWIAELFELRAQLETRAVNIPMERIAELFARAWPQAHRAGAGLDVPAECPYTLDQVLDSSFLPLVVEDESTRSVFLGFDLNRGSAELPHFEIRALAMIGAGLLTRHRGDEKAIRKLGDLARKFDGYRENETVKALAQLLDEAADPHDLDDDTAMRELTKLLKSRGVI